MPALNSSNTAINHLRIARKLAANPPPGKSAHTEISDYFHRCMDVVDRNNFDSMLVTTQDPLAYEAGTCASRFIAKTLAMLG